MPRVTISAVAESLGVSAMTVSRALRNRPGVSATLVIRIREQAMRMGYTPDPEIGKLMEYLRHGSKKGLHANLVALTDFAPDEEPKYCTRLHQHAARHARELGFDFSVMHVPRSRTGWSATLRTLRARGVEGVLLLPMTTETSLPPELWADFAVVSATSSVVSPPFHEVAPNHAANARMIIDHLCADAHRRIGYVGLASHARRTREALVAALAWHHAQGAAPCPPLLHEGSASPDIVSWARSQCPDVILVGRPTDLPTYRATLRKHGLSFSWAMANSRGFFDHAPGLDERDDLIGAAAIDTLSSLVIRGAKGVPDVPTSISITGRWVA